MNKMRHLYKRPVGTVPLSCIKRGFHERVIRTVLIVTISFRPNIGGVETHLDDLCSYLTKKGYHVYVITYQPITTKMKGKRLEKQGNLIVHRIPWFGYDLFHKLESYPLLEFIYLTPMLSIYSLLFYMIHKNEVDVIQAHSLNAAFVAKVLSKVLKKRLIVSIHAIYNLSRRPMLARLVKMTLSSFDTILTLANKSKMELTHIGLDKRRIKVFTYWIDQSVFRPMNKAECKRKLGSECKFVVLFVGRLIEIKGIKVLIEVAIRLSDKKDIFFMFVGDGPSANDVKVASGNFGNIIYVGKVGNKELGTYYNAADVVIVPSLYEEGFGRVILEALSCGTPVIASKRGGIPEALNESVGVLIEPEVDEIMQTIESVYEHPEKLDNLRKNCRLYAIKRFSENNAKIIENAYRPTSYTQYNPQCSPPDQLHK